MVSSVYTYSLDYVIFIVYTQPVKVSNMLDLCGWHLLHRYEAPVICSTDREALSYLAMPGLSRCIAGFGAGPGTQVALDHCLGKASVIQPV